MERHYQNSTSDSAMTEIALALAMGFFSIMVLTMVSMGAESDAGDVSKDAITAKLVQADNKPADAGPSNANHKTQLVIYYKNQFLDQNLAKINPATLSSENQIILAFPPDLEMTEVLSARSKVDHDNLVVSALNDQWMLTLRRTLK